MRSAAEVPTEPPHAIVVAVKGDPPPRGALSRIELDLSKFHNGRWALQLDAAFARQDAPVVILARGIACRAVAWWAQLSPRSYLRSVKGAVFDAPLDVAFEQLAMAAAMRTGPAYRLPFPSIVISDGGLEVEALLALADTWGSRFVARDALPGGGPSNRHERLSDFEEMLLAQAAALGPAPATAAPEPAMEFAMPPPSAS